MSIARMSALSRRGLTPREIAMGRVMFADQIDYRAVHLFYAPFMPHGAMVPVGATIIHGAAWPPPMDFADDTQERQGWFIHELAHVWQAATGTVLAIAKLNALGAGAYRVQLQSGLSFFDYNIEQQAEIARFLFLARMGSPHPESPPVRSLQALWPIKADDPPWT